MKKILMKLCLIMLLIIPCTFVFAACGGDKDKDDKPKTEQSESEPTPEGDSDEEEPEVVVLLDGISVELADEHGFAYDEETNTISFVYADEIAFEKDSFVVNANYSDESSVVVTDYEIDSSAFDETPDVGDYVLKFVFEQKEANINVKITPKPIAKPVNNWGSTKSYTFNEDNSGTADIYSPVDEIEGYDAETMEFSEDSTLESGVVDDYVIKVIPKSNYVWEANEEFGEEENTDAVRFEWSVTKRQIFMSSPETLEFAYEEGVEREVVFVDFSEFFKFEDYFEVIDGTISAEDAGTYTVTISLKEEKLANYYINEINFEEGVDFEYNEDKTQITYTWKIV